MIRIKRGNVAASRRKKYAKLAKGYVGSNSRLSTKIKEQITQSLNNAYIGRRIKKRNFRTFWIYRISAAAQIHNLTYSKFIGLIRKANILLNRKVLAYIAFNDLPIFDIFYNKL